MRETLLLAFAYLSLLVPLPAQDAAEVNPATKPGSVQIVFLPPPMEGTISLGIYSKAGKLVRTLKREAIADKDFTVGLNGLLTNWDGKDDAGTAQKAGVYAARGYMVKGISVSGEAYRGNDWMTDEDSPRVREITGLAPLPKDRVELAAILAGGKDVFLEAGLEGQIKQRSRTAVEQAAAEQLQHEKSEGLGDAKGQPVTMAHGILSLGGGGAALPELHTPVDFSTGKEGSLWVIDKSPERIEVQQYSREGEFLRRLSVAAGEPVPEQIAASTTSDLIYLLERGPGVQRVRGLALENLQSPLPAPDADPEAGAPKSSTWRIVFSKSIHASDDFATAAPLLGRPEGLKAEGKVAVKLAKNPLGPKGEAASVDVSVGVIKTGSVLQTADGLPLCQLTDSPGLKWAALLKDAKGYGLVQSDGAVIEEYRVGKLTGMMAFDAGEYELKW